MTIRSTRRSSFPLKSLQPINEFDPGNPANPLNRYRADNPFNPINKYRSDNPQNPLNQFNTNVPFQRCDKSIGSTRSTRYLDPEGLT